MNISEQISIGGAFKCFGLVQFRKGMSWVKSHANCMDVRFPKARFKAYQETIFARMVNLSK
jgi:hypothetical protein